MFISLTMNGHCFQIKLCFLLTLFIFFTFFTPITLSHPVPNSNVPVLSLAARTLCITHLAALPETSFGLDCCPWKSKEHRRCISSKRHGADPNVIDGEKAFKFSEVRSATLPESSTGLGYRPWKDKLRVRFTGRRKKILDVANMDGLKTSSSSLTVVVKVIVAVSLIAGLLYIGIFLALWTVGKMCPRIFIGHIRSHRAS